MRLTDIYYENAARAVYLAAVIFTIFAPAVHYAGYIITLGFLIYGKAKHGDSIFSLGSGTQRCISLTLIIFFLWSAFINVFWMTDFEVWGRGASVYLEMLIGFFFAARLFNSASSRSLFIKYFVPLTISIYCLIIIKNYIPISFPMSKRLIMNGNTLGLYPTLAAPYIFCCALWRWEKMHIRKLLAVVAAMTVLFISFASGAWLAALFMLPFIFYYGVKAKKITELRNIAAAAGFTVIVLAALNSLSSGFLIERFGIELRQILSINQVKHLTNHRADIWRITASLISDRPLRGYGRYNFEIFYEQAIKENKAFADFEKRVFNHAHNMYLELAFSSGIPSALLFAAAMFLMIRKSWRGRFCLEDGIPWHLIFLIMMCGQLVYGLSGDVFEARRDLAVIFWCSMGIAAALPEVAARKKELSA